jgi:hypothetical protein
VRPECRAGKNLQLTPTPTDGFPCGEKRRRLAGAAFTEPACRYLAPLSSSYSTVMAGNCGKLADLSACPPWLLAYRARSLECDRSA